MTINPAGIENTPESSPNQGPKQLNRRNFITSLAATVASGALLTGDTRTATAPAVPQYVIPPEVQKRGEETSDRVESLQRPPTMVRLDRREVPYIGGETRSAPVVVIPQGALIGPNTRLELTVYGSNGKSPDGFTMTPTGFAKIEFDYREISQLTFTEDRQAVVPIFLNPQGDEVKPMTRFFDVKVPADVKPETIFLSGSIFQQSVFMEPDPYGGIRAVGEENYSLIQTDNPEGFLEELSNIQGMPTPKPEEPEPQYNGPTMPTMNG